MLRPASPRWRRGCSNWAGPPVVTCGSTTVGARSMPTAVAGTRRNCSRSHRMLSCPPLARQLRLGNTPSPSARMGLGNVSAPVGAGFVDSLAQPGGNATGFISYEYGLSAKLLELLREIAPELKRVAVLRDPAIATGIGQLAGIQAAAPSFG